MVEQEGSGMVESGQNNPEEVVEEKKLSREEFWAEMKRRYPQEFAGTPEWALKVRLEAASKMYEETGLIIWV